MQIATAIKHLQKDAEFLGMPFLEFLQFVKASPLAQTQKTLEAFRVFMVQGSALFAPVDE